MTDIEKRLAGNGDDGSLIERQLLSRASVKREARSVQLHTSKVIRAPLATRTTRGQLTVIVVIKRIGVVDHHLADGRGGFDMVGQLATEHGKQAVGMSDCAADRRRVGAVGDVEVRTLNQQSGDPEIPVMS